LILSCDHSIHPAKRPLTTAASPVLEDTLGSPVSPNLESVLLFEMGFFSICGFSAQRAQIQIQSTHAVGSRRTQEFFESIILNLAEKQ
jgi:hypothetical protein